MSAAAQLSIDGVNRAEFWLYRDTAHQNWTHTEDKLDLNLRYGDLRGAFGVFYYEPSRPWAGDRQPLRLLDYTVAYSPKRLEVLYGKFFQTFGKGLALRAYSDDDFRHYKSLHGLRATARLPLRTELVLLGARLRDVFFQENTYQVMNATDSTDQVLGANLSTRPVSLLGLGGRYVRVNRARDQEMYTPPNPRVFTEFVGGDASSSFGPVELYGEVCQRRGVVADIGGRETGMGYYFSGTTTIGWASLLGEYMSYDKLGFPAIVSLGRAYRYNDPPTPIKSGVALNRGVDERGFGVSFTATPVNPLYLEADFGRLFAPKDTNVSVVEWEAKTRYSPGSAWTLEAKFNHMVQDSVEPHVAMRATNRPTIHVNYALGTAHTLALEVEYNWVSEDTGDMPAPLQYHELATSASYGYGEALLFTVGYQQVDMTLERRYKGEKSWPVFEAVWSVTDRNMLRVRYGKEKGGYTCSGGVCREESPFDGVKAQLITRF